MPRTILCQKCGVILNLPDTVTAGKKMKCPKCAYRFEVTERDASSASMPPGSADAAMASSHELARRPASNPELPLFAPDHDLRDMFDSPLASAAAIERSAVSTQNAGLSDAEVLFKDDPAPRRKPKGAEARAQTRRCSRCGGVVPMGMSICVSCGVDQETGMRVGLDDDLAPAALPRSTGPPLHIAIIGLLCGLTSVVLLILALVQSVRDEPGMTQYGWLCLALVSAVGIYGTTQFLLGKTSKMLMLALTLGLVREPDRHDRAAHHARELRGERPGRQRQDSRVRRPRGHRRRKRGDQVHRRTHGRPADQGRPDHHGDLRRPLDLSPVASGEETLRPPGGDGGQRAGLLTAPPG